jgi:hypothetical protein
MSKLLTLIAVFCSLATMTAHAEQTSRPTDLEGSYTLIKTSNTDSSCPTGLRIGDAFRVCPNSLWVQERESQRLEIICNINAGTQKNSSNGHPHSPVPNPERKTVTNTFDSSNNTLTSKTISWSLFSGRESYYIVYTLLKSGNLKFSRKFVDSAVFSCEYTRDASDDIN